jgi:hypothetical protein
MRLRRSPCGRRGSETHHLGWGRAAEASQMPATVRTQPSRCASTRRPLRCAAHGGLRPSAARGVQPLHERTGHRVRDEIGLARKARASDGKPFTDQRRRVFRRSSEDVRQFVRLGRPHRVDLAARGEPVRFQGAAVPYSFCWLLGHRDCLPISCDSALARGSQDCAPNEQERTSSRAQPERARAETGCPGDSAAACPSLPSPIRR